MIEFDPSEYQKCAVSRQTYELTELCLGSQAAELFLYRPPDEVTPYVEATRNTPDPLGTVG